MIATFSKEGIFSMGSSDPTRSLVISDVKKARNFSSMTSELLLNSTASSSSIAERIRKIVISGLSP